jgi:pyrroline-5-carboxylate reductase
MLRRWIEAGTHDPKKVIVIDPGDPVVPPGVRVVRTSEELWEQEASLFPLIMVLAVKPQQMRAASRIIMPALSGNPAVVVSILAGVDEATVRSAMHADSVVRAMPNLPVGIGKGAVALYSTTAGEHERSQVEALIRPLGLMEWIENEALFDVVAALTASGPGFLYRFIDALAEGAAALGLPPEQAQRLATATVEGAGALVASSGESPHQLAERVASPGGITRQGLNVLDDGKALNQLVHRTLEAAVRRSREMGEEARSR